MRITPLDARKQEFSKSMRGFDCDEVRAFLNTLADEYETVLIDNKQIRDRVMEQDDKITEYKSMERTLRDTLMTAERVMQETRENANREGDLIIQEAQMKAKGIMEECRLRTEELRREIMGLRKEKETYLARFRSLAEAQIKFVDNHESDFEDLDRRLVDIVDSVVTNSTQKSAPPSAPASAPREAKPQNPATQGNAAPTVAPAPVAAPVAGEQDIWRDYNPGSKAQTALPAAAAVATAGPPVPAAAPAAPPVPSTDDDVAASIADLVSESLTESGNQSGDQSGNRSADQSGNGTGAETGVADEAAFRPALEPLEIDVISTPFGPQDQADQDAEAMETSPVRF